MSVEVSQNRSISTPNLNSPIVAEWYRAYDQANEEMQPVPEELEAALYRKAAISTEASWAILQAGMAPLDAFDNFCQRVDVMKRKARDEADLNTPPKLSLTGFMTGLKQLDFARRELLGEPQEDPIKRKKSEKEG
jgi:hypothetical protein